MGNQDFEQHKAMFDAYRDERSRLQEQHRANGARALQLLIGGAAGALILSVAFLGNIAPNLAPGTSWRIGTAWVGFVLAIVLSFAAYFTVAKSIEASTHDLDAAWEKFKQSGEWNPEFPDSAWDTATGWLAVLAMLFLLGGVVMLMWFAWANLPA